MQELTDHEGTRWIYDESAQTYQPIAPDGDASVPMPSIVFRHVYPHLYEQFNQPHWSLSEEQIRAKVIELLDGMSQTRMDLWIISGTSADVFDGGLAMRIMQEELPKRAPEVIEFWSAPCSCCGHPN